MFKLGDRLLEKEIIKRQDLKINIKGIVKKTSSFNITIKSSMGQYNYKFKK